MKKSKRLLALILSISMVVSGLFVSSPVQTRAEVPDAEKQDLKILILGNSYGRDAYEYLYEVFQQSGKYNRVIIGDLFMSGQSLQGHVSSLLSAEGVDTASSPKVSTTDLQNCAVGGQLSYHYYKSEGTTELPYNYATETGQSFKETLLEEEWDIVTIQQAPKFTNNGEANNQFALDTTLLKALGDETTMSNITGKTYTDENSYVDVLYDYIKANCPNAKIYYHQTFANVDAGYYNNYDDVKVSGVDATGPQKMFLGLSNWTESHINDYIGSGKTVAGVTRALDGIVPAGASMMYLYESMPDETLKNKLYRDNIHLASEGRYLAALTWYHSITGNPVTDVTDNYVPNFACYEILDTLKEAVEFGASCIQKNSTYQSPEVKKDGETLVIGEIQAKKDIYSEENRAKALELYGIAGYETFDTLYDASDWQLYTSIRTQNDYTTSVAQETDGEVVLKDARESNAYCAVGNSPSGKVASLSVQKDAVAETITQQEMYYTGYDSTKEISRLSFMTQIPAWDAGDSVVYLSYTNDRNWTAYFPQHNQIRTCVDGAVSVSGLTNITPEEAGCSANADGNYAATNVQGAYHYITVDMQYRVESQRGYYYVTITGVDDRNTNNPVNIARNFYKFEVSGDVTADTGMIDTLRFGYLADYNNGDRTTYFDNIEYSYYDAADAADLDEKIAALPQEVSTDNEDKINALYKRYQTYVKAGTDGLIVNGDKIELQKKMLDVLKEYPEAAELLKDIDSLGAITTAEQKTVANLRETYDALPTDVQALITNYDKLVKAEATLTTLSTQGLDFYDDFDGVQYEHYWTLANDDVEADYAAAIKALLDSGTLAEQEQTAAATKLSSPYVDGAGGDGKDGTKGLCMSRTLNYPKYVVNWSTIGHGTIPYSRIYEIDGLDAQHGIIKAEFDYAMYDWQASSYAIIIVSYKDAYNWEGFTIGRWTNEIYSVQVSGSKGNVNVETQNKMTTLVYEPDDKGGFAENWKHVKMEYTTDVNGQSVYAFEVSGQAANDSNTTVTASFEYPVSKPLDNMRFTTTGYLNNKALVDNVKLNFLSDEMTKLDAKIGDLSTVVKKAEADTINELYTEYAKYKAMGFGSMFENGDKIEMMKAVLDYLIQKNKDEFDIEEVVTQNKLIEAMPISLGTYDAFQAVKSKCDEYDEMGLLHMVTNYNMLTQKLQKLEEIKKADIFYQDDFDDSQLGKNYWELKNKDIETEIAEYPYADFYAEKLQSQIFTESPRSDKIAGGSYDGSNGLALNRTVNYGFNEMLWDYGFGIGQWYTPYEVYGEGGQLDVSATEAAVKAALDTYNKGEGMWASDFPARISGLKDDVLGGNTGVLSAEFKLKIWNHLDTLNTLVFPIYEGAHSWEAIGIGQGTTVVNRQAIEGSDGSYKYSDEIIARTLKNPDGSDATENFAYGSWVTVKMEYQVDETGAAKYVYTISGVGTESDSLTYTMDYPVDHMVDNLYIAARANFDTPTIDDVKLVMANAPYVEELITAIPELSALQASDAPYANGVKDIYESLSDTEKAKVSNAQKLTDALAQIETILNDYAASVQKGQFVGFDNFEDDIKYITAHHVKDDKEWGVVSNPYMDSVNSSNKVLKVTNNYDDSADAGNCATYLFLENIADGSQALATMNVKLLVDDWWKNTTFIYDYQDENNWSGIGFNPNYAGSGETRGLVVYPIYKVEGKVVERYYAGTNIVLYDEELSSDYDSRLKWIDIQVNYALTECSITIDIGGKLGRPYNNTYTLLDTNATRVGVVGYSGTAYFDDLAVTLKDTDEGIEAENFRSAHEYILALRTVNLADIDEEALETAEAAYEALSEGAKYGLRAEKKRLDTLRTRMNVILADSDSIQEMVRANNNYASYSDTFDSSFSLWRYQDADTWAGVAADNMTALGHMPTVEYSEELGSFALKLNGTTLVLKDSLLPEKAQLTKFSVTACLSKDNTVAPKWDRYRIYYSYTDEENWQAIDFYWSDSGEDTYQEGQVVQTMFSQMSDGGYGEGWDESTTFNPLKPIQFNLSYTDGKVVIEMIQEGHETKTYTKTVQKQGFIALASSNSRLDVYFDNVSVEMTKGDWDDDMVIDDMAVFYTGNTFVHTDETVSISGQNLGNLVKEVQIMQVADKDVSAVDRQYAERKDFSFSGVLPGTFTQEPMECVWGEAYKQAGTEIIKPKIISKSEDFVKFIIPDSFSDGIYAVKLISKTGGEKVIYLNTPYVDYVVGDDGKHATPGGSFRIIGNNIAASMDGDNRTIRALKALLVDVTTKEVTEVTVSERQSDYSVRVDVPADMKCGTYELWLHTGFGDDSCWAIPTVVEVKESIRSTWPSYTINMKDYGATGSNAQNVTGIVTKALQELADNGGGVLYFPRGIYRFEQPIVLPENVSIRGESMEDTQFLWTSFKWQVGELTPYLIAAHANVEIRDISFYGQRVGGFISVYGNEGSENIYVENVRTHFQPNAGAPTNAPLGTTPLVDSLELQAIVQKESVSHLFHVPNRNTDNVQIKNSDFLTYGKHRGIVTSPHDVPTSNYWQIDGLNMNADWSCIISSNTIVENSRFYEDSCAGMFGNGMYVDNCSFEDSTVNNRELMVFDMGATYTGATIYQESPDDPYTYILNSEGSWSQLFESQLYVVRGQGEGQTRIITHYERIDDTRCRIKVDNPFQIAPNKNSRITIRLTRESIYFVDNNQYNGGCFGSFGGFSDMVFDGNTVQRVGGSYQWAMGDDVCWYFTQLNQKTIYDPYHFGNLGSEGGSDFSHVIVRASGYRDARGFVYRNNDFNGYDLDIRSDGNESVYDMTLENNSFYKSENGINLYGYGANKITNGMVIRNNVFDLVDNPYSYAVSAYTKYTNSVGYKHLVLMESDETQTSKLKLGDVNGDGEITLKDSTLIAYHVAGKLVLTNEQMKRADVNGDNHVTMVDCTMIRYYILGDIKEF